MRYTVRVVDTDKDGTDDNYVVGMATYDDQQDAVRAVKYASDLFSLDGDLRIELHESHHSADEGLGDLFG